MADALGSSAAGSGHLEFTIGTPAGWFRMPGLGALGALDGPTAPPALRADWIGDIVAETALTGRQAEALSNSLSRVAHRAEQQHRPGRLRLLYVGIPPRTSVQAWASVDLFRANGTTPTAFETTMREAAAAASNTTDVWHREVSRSELGGYEAVTTHDLLTVSSSGDRRVQHRFVASLFVTQSDQIVQLQLSTPNLAAFDDLEAVGRSMADSIVVRPTVPPAPAGWASGSAAIGGVTS